MDDARAEESPPGDRLLNRELSWLAFNDRVLSMASDPDVPLLERVRFLAISASNLDEFFQVRVAGLKDQIAGDVTRRSADGLTPRQQVLHIGERVEAMIERQELVLESRILPALRRNGVNVVSWSDLAEDDQKLLIERFEERIFPILTPLAVDQGHPFPYISNLSLNLAVMLRDPNTGSDHFARVKIPATLGRFLALPDDERFVRIEEIIGAQLPTLFPGMDIVSADVFRVSRNADLIFEDEEADDLLSAVEMELRRRRFGRAVRLEISTSMSDETRAFLEGELDVDSDDVTVHSTLVDLTGLDDLSDIDRPELKYRPHAPVTEMPLRGVDGDGVDMFAAIRKSDILVHYPYNSFGTSIEEFISQASADPAVLAIKMTLYRTAREGRIINALARAAEQGKQVAVAVEIRARFDEAANIGWAKRLEEAGVHVSYGLLGLKVHSKTVLVVRDEGRVIRRYSHIGTGNYNSRTARMYEDLGLFTCDAAIGDDLIHLFNHLTGYSRSVSYEKLLVAPDYVRDRLIELIRAEHETEGAQGRIVMKMNSLVDPRVIDELYAASQAGVEIDLIVRGICCLRPGIPGLSDRIRVRSIIGRFLEHSRIYWFANGSGPGEAKVYIGSPDLMPRNLDRRVEALVPVEDPALRDRVGEVLLTNLGDSRRAWTLDGDGEWTRLPADEHGIDTHLRMQELAGRRALRNE